MFLFTVIVKRLWILISILCRFFPEKATSLACGVLDELAKVGNSFPCAIGLLYTISCTKFASLVMLQSNLWFHMPSMVVESSFLLKVVFLRWPYQILAPMSYCNGLCIICDSVILLSAIQMLVPSTSSNS